MGWRRHWVRHLLVAVVALFLVGSVQSGEAVREAAADMAVTTPSLKAQSDMWVVLDPGHGWTYGRHARRGAWTGHQAHGYIEDMETVRIMADLQAELDRLPPPTVIRTARLRAAPFQGESGERNVANWDGDRRAWLDSPPFSSRPNITSPLEVNRKRANYDRAAFANSQPYGGHNPGKIFISLHLDHRRISERTRGTVIFMPCYAPGLGGQRIAAVPPDCRANRQQYAESRRLALQICRQLRALPGWPGCRLGIWAEDFTVLREIEDRTPGVLVELINLADGSDARLLEPKMRQAAARQLAAAIAAYYLEEPSKN